MVWERQRQDKLNNKLQSERLTEEQIQDIKAFVFEVGEGLLESDNDLVTKRRYFELLDLKVKLGLEDGKQIIDLECKLGKKRGMYSEFATWTI